MESRPKGKKQNARGVLLPLLPAGLIGAREGDEKRGRKVERGVTSHAGKADQTV